MSNLISGNEMRVVDFFLRNAPRFIFFTGKGGVGKTSLSCATALSLADRGEKILLVSTDPASNLDQVLEVVLGPRPTAIPGTSNLWAMNIDPRQSAEQYREKMVGPYRGVLPAAAVAEIEEQLSGACTVEIAAFNEFSRLMTDKEVIAGYDHIVFDTAPTGHTIRLLQLPAAWKGYLKSSSGNASCLGPMSGLQGQEAQFSDTLKALIDERITSLFLVARPDERSLDEARRTSMELSGLGVKNQQLAINGVLGNADEADRIALAMHHRQESALTTIPSELSNLPRVEIPLSPTAPIGIDGIRRLLAPMKNLPLAKSAVTGIDVLDGAWSLTDLVNSLDKKSGVVMTMGKGGVGKTTMATAIAIELARRGSKVHLTTSDPAAHLDQSLSQRHNNLRVSRINPTVETELYRQEVMQQAGKDLDAEGRRLLEEDLRSPCTEEIAVFRAFARIVDEAKDSVVIMDTAPTGHTILLLDATEAYHREVSRNRSSVPDEVKSLLPRLRDPRFTRIMIVALPEATPVQEAIDLQKDLKRAGIFPYAWIVNQCLAPLEVLHPVLKIRRMNEFKYIGQVRALAPRIALVPWQESETFN